MQSGAACTAGELEHAFAGSQRRKAQDPLGELGGARVDVVGVLAPRRSDGRPPLGLKSAVAGSGFCCDMGSPCC